MHDPAEGFLSKAERSRIEDRVRLAEKRTSGEIVVMVVPSSSAYASAGFMPAMLAALLFAVPVAEVFGSGGMWFFLSLFLPAFVFCNELVRRIAPLCRMVLPRSLMREAVEEQAFASFYRQGVFETEAKTGILIYISIFERKVRVIADSGIDEKVAPGAWQEVVDGIVAGVRGGTQADAIALAVDRCGELLSVHFPVLEGDVNELEDSIRF